MSVLNSAISYTAKQLTDAPSLELSSTHESVINTLRVNAVTDSETFVYMFESETALKDGAADLGFDLVSGGLLHKREFARVVTAWITATVMAETR